MNANNYQDATAAAVGLISTNMLQQIIALQEAINSREPQQRFPTMQEANLLTKMIAGLEKLKRFIAPPKQSTRSKADGDNPSGTVEELYDCDSHQQTSSVIHRDSFTTSGVDRINLMNPSATVGMATATSAANIHESAKAGSADAPKNPYF